MLTVCCTIVAFENIQITTTDY